MSGFNYERKIYSLWDKCSIDFLSTGVVGLLPEELASVRGKVLDIGCGAGFYTGRILKRNLPRLKVYGIDISRKAIKLARRDYPKIEFKSASAYDLPFADNFFDAILINCVLEHLQKPDYALQEASRVLKPNGILFSITPIEGDRAVFFQNQKLTKKIHGHVQRFNREELISILNRNGFIVKRYYFTGYLFCQIVSWLYLNIQNTFGNSVKSPTSNTRLNPIKYLINFLINLESFILPNNIPGLYMHIICQKK